MRVLVDCPIWSLGLRRRPRDLNPEEIGLVREWRSLVIDGAAVLVGPVRQECLSGFRREEDFERLRKHLESFEDVPLESEDYVEAARFFNRCRSVGVTGTDVDLLLCAFASRRGFPILTNDGDFELLARHLPIRLHRER